MKILGRFYHTKSVAKSTAMKYNLIARRRKFVYEYFDLNLQDVSFEWDDEKEAINFEKHGIHFKTAAKVFLDPYKMIREDEEHPEEQRYDILGRVGKVLFVVCAFNEGNVIRIISARIATKPERYEYGEDDFE